MFRTSRQDGFTLIELLVVIAIIAILAGLLMPALEMARTKARETTCRSQLKQFDTALEMYRNEFEQTAQRDGWPAWLSNLYGSRHLESLEVYICPSDASQGKEGGKPPWDAWAGVTSGGVMRYTTQYREADDLPDNKTGDDWTYEVPKWGSDDTWTVVKEPYTIRFNDEDIEPYKIRTEEVEACSYLYELCAAWCYWHVADEASLAADPDKLDPDDPAHDGNGDGVPSWCEVKLTSEVQGVGASEENTFYSCVPVVRCFHHTTPKWATEENMRNQLVLNLALSHNVYSSDPSGDGWKKACKGSDWEETP